MQKKLTLLIVAVCSTLIFFIDNVLIQNRTNELMRMVTMVSEHVYERLDSARSLVELAAKTQDVSSLDAPTAEGFLLQIAENDPAMWSHFLMTHLDGIEFVHTEGEKHYGKSIADREYFQTPHQKQETVVAQPVHSVSTGRKIIAIGTPVYRDGAFSSVLVGFIHLQYVSELINRTTFTSHSYQMMVNRDGTISAHPNGEFVLSENLQNIVIPETFDRITAMQSGSRIERVHNQPSLLLFAPIEAYGLSVVTVIPLAEAYMNVIIIDLFLIAAFVFIWLVLHFQKRLKHSRDFAVKMSERAMTDSLTGLYNRQWLQSLTLSSFCARGFTVLFLDIDNFKGFNDRNNHKYGDDVLKFVAQTLLSCTRAERDVCLRYAGDEFLVLFREPDPQQAGIVAARVMAQLLCYGESTSLPDPITISCGIAAGYCDRHSLQEIITAADDAAYTAKKNGKNCITYADL